ncbi:hypothetical protein ACFV4G_43135, partial [Kitasatospora sp. NPDC059747]|uniref:hypothetical protein n=1 Tax=Kitasatospora sp. NPDC059747 TaxID=3346930 RepID=UPI00364E4E87
MEYIPPPSTQVSYRKIFHLVGVLLIGGYGSKAAAWERPLLAETSPLIPIPVYHATPGSGSTRYRPQSQGIAHDLVHPHHPIPHLIRGIPMSIDQISLPKGVGPQAIKLLDAITGADTKEDLNRAGGKAEGFVLGLESAKAI